MLFRGLCSSTPRGDGNARRGTNACPPSSFWVYAAQPREGTETLSNRFNRVLLLSWFMQLNPARGRKLSPSALRSIPRNPTVYAAQPREGTETWGSESANLLLRYHRVYAAQPREGTETWSMTRTLSTSQPGLCSSTPRGDGNLTVYLSSLQPMQTGLCSSTPRGDGNSSENPRFQLLMSGLCSSTPRGDGNSYEQSMVNLCFLRFMQLNPARGRKLKGPTNAIPGNLNVVYAAQPREGTET